MAMREGVRRWAIRGSLVGLVASTAALVGVAIGRPIYYSDGLRAIAGPQLAGSGMLQWRTPEPELELPGPVQGRVAQLPDGRLCYGRTKDDGDTDLVLFDPARSGLPPEPAYGLVSEHHELAPAVGPVPGAREPAGFCLYFASDRAGGQGGYDLWFAAWANGTFAPPEPVPFVNTSRDETDPAPSPDGTELLFVRVDRSVRQGDNGVLHRHTLGSDVDAPELYPVAERRLDLRAVDRDPVFAPDGAALWFVRRERGQAAHVFRASRLGADFDVAARVDAGWGSSEARSPLPSGDGFRLRVLQPRADQKAPDLLHVSQARELYPWWPGQRWLELLLLSIAGSCALLLVLLLLGRRFGSLDLLTQCLILSLLLHLLVMLWLMRVEIMGSLAPSDGDQEGTISVALVADAGQAQAADAEGPTTESLAVLAAYRPDLRPVTAEAPAAAAERAERSADLPGPEAAYEGSASPQELAAAAQLRDAAEATPTRDGADARLTTSAATLQPLTAAEAAAAAAAREAAAATGVETESPSSNVAAAERRPVAAAAEPTTGTTMPCDAARPLEEVALQERTAATATRRSSADASVSVAPLAAGAVVPQPAPDPAGSLPPSAGPAPAEAGPTAAAVPTNGGPERLERTDLAAQASPAPDLPSARAGAAQVAQSDLHDAAVAPAPRSASSAAGAAASTPRAVDVAVASPGAAGASAQRTAPASATAESGVTSNVPAASVAAARPAAARDLAAPAAAPEGSLPEASSGRVPVATVREERAGQATAGPQRTAPAGTMRPPSAAAASLADAAPDAGATASRNVTAAAPSGAAESAGLPLPDLARAKSAATRDLAAAAAPAAAAPLPAKGHVPAPLVLRDSAGSAVAAPGRTSSSEPRAVAAAAAKLRLPDVPSTGAGAPTRSNAAASAAESDAPVAAPTAGLPRAVATRQVPSTSQVPSQPLPAAANGRARAPQAIAVRDGANRAASPSASTAKEPATRPGPAPLALPTPAGGGAVPFARRSDSLGVAASVAETPAVPGSLLERATVRTPLASSAAAVATLQGTPYSNRFGPARAKAIEQFGGSAATEAAVAKGLAYLASIQRRDGSWGDPERWDSKYGQVYVGKTALCLLAFLGAGHTPQSKTQYSAVARRAVQHLLSIQDDQTGAFGPSSAYGHGISTYALAECYGITKDQGLRGPVSRALDWIITNQGPRRDRRNQGGWGYFSPGLSREDDYARMSISAWMIMALESAKLAGLELPEDVLPKARRYVEQSYDQQNAWFRYNHKPSRLGSEWPTLPASTPAAAFCLMLFGERETERVAAALDYTVERRPTEYRRFGDDDFVQRGQGNVYFWYYGTLACFLAGGDTWTLWNETLSTLLPASQSDDGSFAPIDQYAQYAGDDRRDRSYTTAMCVLSLEIYYRYFTPLLVGR